MAMVVVAGAILRCSHLGSARLTIGDPHLSVDGRAAVTAGKELGISFAPGAPGVLTPCPFSTPAGASPCTATVAASAGVSTLLLVGGVGVLLDSAGGQAINANDPAATWSVLDPGQTRLAVGR
jgi:hypothetical protein